MKEPIYIAANDPIISKLKFRPYRNMAQRKVVPFLPEENEPQTIEVDTPWGAKLTAKKGDLLVSELDKPNDIWPVDADIFDESYIMIGIDRCIKRAVTLLVPLVDVTGGDENRLVTVESMEGNTTVRAGDFYLAKGQKGEIWAFPKEKVLEIMRPVE
jgi:hypothetical protein